MASRSGVGKVRHPETRALLLQDQIQRQKLEMEKCSPEDNVSDVGTKALNEKRHSYLVKKLGMRNLSESKQEAKVAATGH